MKVTIDESFVNGGFSALMTFLETRIVPVPPARMCDPNADNAEGRAVPAGRLLCPPADEDEKTKGGDDDEPIEDTIGPVVKSEKVSSEIIH